MPWLTIQHKLLFESIEIPCLLWILWHYWRQWNNKTRIWGIVLLIAIGIDFFGFHAARPTWIGVVLNIPLWAGVFIYGKIKRPILQLYQVCLAAVLSLFR
jgi:hypothetical protein